MSRMFFLVACLCLSSSTMGHAQDTEKSPEIGDQAPNWSELVGTDDKKHSMDEFRDKDVLVVCFTCNSCPYAVDYEDRMIALQKKFVTEGINAQLVAINANTVDADKLEKMKDRASEKKFNYPYLWDESQTVAKAYGAIYTPEFYVLNKQRKIIYRGALDDSTLADKVQLKYVELAVTAAVTGATPEVEKTGARGCGIRYNRKRR